MWLAVRPEFTSLSLSDRDMRLFEVTEEDAEDSRIH